MGFGWEFGFLAVIIGAEEMTLREGLARGLERGERYLRGFGVGSRGLGC